MNLFTKNKFQKIIFFRYSVFLIFIFFLYISAYGENNSIGDIVLSGNKFEITNINCTEVKCTEKRKNILPGDRIKTYTDAVLHIRLKDGTAIKIQGPSDLIIYNIRFKEKDKPSRIFAEYGRIKVMQNNQYVNTSMIVETKNAIIKSVNAHLHIAAAKDETALLVYRGEAGLASTDPAKTEAYIIQQGNEIFIHQGENPGKPSPVKSPYHSSWLSRFIISPDRISILRYRENQGILDWLFQKKGE